MKPYIVSAGKYEVPITVDDYQVAVIHALRRLAAELDGIPEEDLSATVVIANHDEKVFLPTKKAMEMAGLKRVPFKETAGQHHGTAPTAS